MMLVFEIYGYYLLIFSVTLWHMSILFKVPLEDHPRMCGEQNQLLMDQVPIPGSPPRVRGTVHLCARSRRRSRITPACAGNRPCSPRRGPASRDHPRVCGEQPGAPDQRGQGIGSPPRVRGTAGGPHAHRRRGGITPACAGNRRFLQLRDQIKEDHPRVCGEQVQPNRHTTAYEGSPPRVRGTGQHLIRDRVRQGITPACAGNSLCLALDWLAAGDHPRVCGEQLAAPLSCGSLGGSPPRVRGTGVKFSSFFGFLRITPACAGNRPPQA